MAITINDGKGRGYQVEVDTTNRLRARSIVEDEGSHAAELGQRYNINTGTITLTSASSSAVLYFANTGNSDYVIEEIVLMAGPSTSGTGAIVYDVYFNSTGGTIVSTASAVPINANLNLGSANTISANIYKGAEGNTLTGGTRAISSLAMPSNRVSIGLGKVIVPKGKNVGVTVTPPTGNTSMRIQAAFRGYSATEDVNGGTVS